MSRLAALAAAFVLTLSPVALADPPPPAIVSVLHAFEQAAAGADSAAFTALFVHDARITDTLSPYHWQGPDAPAHYFADLQTALKAADWSGTRFTESEPPFVVRSGDSAYASLSLRMDYRAHGTARQDQGIFALSLRHEGDRWRITSASWAYTKSPF